MRCSNGISSMCEPIIVMMPDQVRVMLPRRLLSFPKQTAEAPVPIEEVSILYCRRSCMLLNAEPCCVNTLLTVYRRRRRPLDLAWSLRCAPRPFRVWWGWASWCLTQTCSRYGDSAELMLVERDRRVYTSCTHLCLVMHCIGRCCSRMMD